MTRISIFILCYNEQTLIKDTILHHRRLHPNALITIYDNYSTDKSPDIARDMGCNVIQWDRGTEISNLVRMRIKNTCWNDISSGWIMVCDMDEWACITDDELDSEEAAGTTVIQFRGMNMVTPHCERADLSDIDLHTVEYGNDYGSYKCLIFRAELTAMNFGAGAHTCKPQPSEKVRFNTRNYYFKHYDLMCLPSIKRR